MQIFTLSKGKRTPILDTRDRAEADPGLWTVSTQTLDIHLKTDCHYFEPGLRLAANHKASPLFRHYQIILLGDKGQSCEQLVENYYYYYCYRVEPTTFQS